MVTVYNLYDDEEMFDCESVEEAEQWIGNCALTWNYGFLREWREDGKHCFDVGPRVFYIKEE